jgi:hypothetical protein
LNLKSKIAVTLIGLLSSVSIYAAPPPITLTTDVENPFAWTLNLYAGNTPTIVVSVQTNGAAYTGLGSGWSCFLNYGKTDYATALKSITGAVDAATGTLTFNCLTNAFPAAGDYYGEIYLENGNTKITTGHGLVHVKRSPSSGAFSAADLSYRLNWDLIVSSGHTPWSDFDTNALQSQITANLASQVATSAVFQALFDAQKNTNTGFQASITNLNGFTNYAYLGWSYGNWATNGLATTNQLGIVSQMVVTAQSDITNNLANQALTNTAFQALHDAQANTNVGFEIRMVTVETGKMSLATQNSSNATLQTQITLNLTNQNATNTILQNAIDAVGTGTWSLALLTDGSRPANYINVANTNFFGNELITNGSFTGSASNWSLSTFYYQANRVILNPSLTGQIEYTNTLVVTTNKLYQLTVKTTYAGAAITGTVGGVSYAWTAVDGETHNEFFYALNNSKPIISASTGTNSLELDDVTLQECPTGSVFVAQNVNAGNSVIARVGVYAPNIMTISNDLDTAESDIVGLKTSTGTLNTAVANLNTASNALNSNKLNLSGGIMTGPLTNNVAYYGNGVGLTNISASSTGLAWTAVSGTPTNYGAGGYGILDIPAATTSLAFSAITATPTSLSGYGITNDVGDSMTRYFARTNSGEQVEVLASGAGIVATRTNEIFNVVIPAGVRLFSLRLRIDGGETDSGIIRLALGTTDMAMGVISTMWIPSGNAINETSFANVVLVCRPDPDDLNLIKVSGLGTVAGTTYNCHFNF